MALTPSNMLPLGTPAPAFALQDAVTHKTITLSDVRSEIATVVIFMCNHCPYVKHILQSLVETARRYQAKGIRFVAINSNDISAYPEDSPERMHEYAQEFGYPFPYLFDPTQTVAKAYQAACTPDFYVFDKNLECIYRGRFDDSTPGNNIPVTGKDLASALDATIAGKPVNPEQLPSVGCNIKWKK